MISELLVKGINMVFPRNIYCICCGSIIDDSRSYSLCDSCIEKVNWVADRTCGKCGKILADGYSHSLCSDCRETDHHFDKGYTCTRYSLYERAMVTELKYKDKSYIGKIIGDVLADRMEAELGPEVLSLKYDFVIPVPVSEDRYESRGYNQAEIMAGRFSKRTGIPMATGVLKRTASTEAMKDLSRSERYSNIRGAFTVTDYGKKILPLSKIILVDDIYTTGATADECARMLKKAGAGQVDVLTFAAGADIIYS